MTTSSDLSRLGDACRYQNFPEEAIRALEKTEERLLARPESRTLLDRATDALFLPGDDGWDEAMRKAAETARCDRMSADMVMLLRGLPRLLERYRAAGHPEKLFRDTTADLRCKLNECYACYGVWGCFVTFWYPGFYRLTRFALGRLQYEKIAFPHDDYAGVRRGETVYNCHIPSSGRLTDEQTEDSLARAAAFYGTKDGVLPVYCSSWLLYPPMAEAIYPAGSNLRRFYERFTVLAEAADPDNGNFWRVFHCRYSPEALKNAPEDTSLQRRLKRYLLDGGQMGSGKGLLLYRA